MGSEDEAGPTPINKVQVGDTVRLVGMTDTYFEGRTGEVILFDAAKNRYNLRLADGRKVNVPASIVRKDENIERRHTIRMASEHEAGPTRINKVQVGDTGR